MSVRRYNITREEQFYFKTPQTSIIHRIISVLNTIRLYSNNMMSACIIPFCWNESRIYNTFSFWSCKSGICISRFCCTCINRNIYCNNFVSRRYVSTWYCYFYILVRNKNYTGSGVPVDTSTVSLAVNTRFCAELASLPPDRKSLTGPLAARPLAASAGA